MDAMTRKRVLLLLYGCITACLGQSIIEAPVHTAAIIGHQAQFNYSATYPTGSDSVKWGFYDETSGSASLRTIYTDAQGITGDASPYFDVDDTIQDQYDLIVLNVEEKLAGKYFAGFAISDVKTEPQLVVLSEMTCTPTAGTVVDEGNYINYGCSVRYKGYKAPRLRWMNELGEEVFGNWHEDETTNTITYTANMTADWSLDHHVMTCHLDFVQDDGETNPPPTFTHHCQTHYSVTYHTNQIVIYPNPDDGVLTMYEGQEINCTGNGNPAPTDTDHTWYCGGVFNTQGQILPIEGDLIKEETTNFCNCTALNYIGGVNAGWFKTVSFNAYPDPNDNTGGGSASAGVIAAAVIIPLVLIGVVVAVVIFFFMKKKNQSEKPPKPPMNAATHSEPLRQPTSMAPSVRERPPPQPEPRGAPARNGPPYGGQPTPFTTGQTRQGYPGKGSPGHADLGSRALSSSVPGLNQSHESISSLQDQKFYPPPVNHNPSGSQV